MDEKEENEGSSDELIDEPKSESEVADPEVSVESEQETDVKLEEEAEEDEEEELRITRDLDAIIDTDFVDVVEQSAGITIFVDYEPIFETTRIPEGYDYEDDSSVTGIDYLVRVKSIDTTQDPPLAILEVEEDGDELYDSPLYAHPGEAFWLENDDGDETDNHTLLLIQ